jgi:hypothetical protein
MTDIEERFLDLLIVKQMKYAEIEKELNVNRKQVSKWWDDLKVERVKLAKVRAIWLKKFASTDFWVFHKWFVETERKCCYCDITEVEIKKLIEANQINTKRLTTRGRSLELERKNPNEPYDNIKNLAYCCYWCNNAKTDEFSVEEFSAIGEEVKKVWKKRLSAID